MASRSFTGKSARPLDNEHGATIVLAALSMAALMSVVALAVDVGMLFDVRTEAQRTADAAALAGAGRLIVAPGNEDLARQTAIDFGGRNTVYGDPAVILPEDVDVDLDRRRVTVTVRRTADRNSAIGTWFANVFGVSQADVAARATAEAYPVGSAMCVKPFAIPDRFFDADGDGIFDPGQDDYDPEVHGYGSSWRNPLEPGDDGQGLIDDFGRPIVLKGGGPNGGWGATSSNGTSDSPTYPNTGPSWYYAWDIPMPDDAPSTGAARYRWNIANCNPAIVSVGEEYMVEDGAMTGPTVQGTEDLYDLDPYARWDESTDQVTASAWGSSWEGSPRIGIVPVFHPAREFEPGKQPIEFTNFIAVFFEGVEGEGNDQILYGRILYPTGIGGGTDAAPATYSIRLVE